MLRPSFANSRMEGLGDEEDVVEIVVDGLMGVMRWWGSMSPIVVVNACNSFCI